MEDIGFSHKESERRQTTILFADLSGFTSLSEKMDPEEVTFLINDCLKIMGNCIEEYEGTIDKFMGDCVMAVFGLPKAIENAPQKSVNAAIQIRKRLTEFLQTKKTPYPMDIHVGINTGMVVAGPVGIDGNKEYTVMGDAVNIASRLKDISSAGQIFVGESTYRHVRDQFQFKPSETVTVKGKNKTVNVYELVSKKSIPDRSDRMVSSVLVGRKKELDKLSLQVLKVINGEGSIVNLIGEAGIGKSRLMAEIRQREEMDRMLLLEGRAISSGKNLSFHPIIDLLKKWSGINEDDNDKISALKLENRIQSVAGDETLEIFPFIAVMMGINLWEKYAKRIQGIEGNALEKLISKNLKSLFAKIALTQPLMIVWEDLHWADLTSLQLLEALYRLAGEFPILFVNVFRPGYKETGDRVQQFIQDRYPAHLVNIRLKPLPEEECDHLINNLLKIRGFPLDVKDQIMKRTGGNPFFIEEIIRSFIDDGIILIRNNRFEITQKIDSVVIPATINEVIMGRIDRLDDTSKSILKTAAVIGRSFYYKILRRMTEVEKEFDDRLAFLEDIQLITKQYKKEEIAYLFKHALAQEATYESILIRKRKELHLMTARVIENIFEDKISEFFGILAWHYSKGEDFEKAEEYLIKAGEEAMRTSASSEAINYFQDALTLYSSHFQKETTPDKLADLEMKLGIALYYKGQFGEAIAYFDRTLSSHGIRPRSSTPGTQLTIISGLAHLFIALYLPSFKWRKVPDSKEMKVNRLLAFQLGCTGFVESERIPFLSFRFIKRMTAFNLRQTENGIHDFCVATFFFSYVGLSFGLHRKILSFLEDKINPENPAEKMMYHFSRVINVRMEGHFPSFSYDQELVVESLRIGNLQDTSFYIIFSFFIDLGLGRFKNAAQKIEKLQEMVRLFDNYTVEGWVYLSKAKLLTKQRKLPEALFQIEKFIAFCKKVEDKAQFLWGLVTKSYIQFLLKDIRGAEHTMQKVADYRQGEVLNVFKTTLILSDLVINLHHLENNTRKKDDPEIKKYTRKTRKSIKIGIRIAGKIADDRVELLKCTGTYYWLVGKKRTALKWWYKGMQAGERMQALPELARLYAEVARRLNEHDDKVKRFHNLSPDQLRTKAIGLFEQLNLETDLAEMTSVSGK